MPPHGPQAMSHRLPPILRRRAQAPRPGYSKAPRGLFVLSRVTRIFTGPSISPSPPSRQCSSRYAFRAGRYLPDKEFRYLRTVIVTAAVHRGFTSRLRSGPRTDHTLTSPFHLPALGRHQPLYIASDSAWQRPVFLVNSRLSQFAAAPSRRTVLLRRPYRGAPSPEVTGLICRVP